MVILPLFTNTLYNKGQWWFLNLNQKKTYLSGGRFERRQIGGAMIADVEKGWKWILPPNIDWLFHTCSDPWHWKLRPMWQEATFVGACVSRGPIHSCYHCHHDLLWTTEAELGHQCVCVWRHHSLRLVANGLGTFHYWYSSYYQSITTLIETYGTNPFQACVRVFHRLRNLRDVYMDRIFSPGCLLCLHVMPSASNQEREIQASRKAEVCWAATSVFNQWFVWNACLFYFCSFSFRFDMHINKS